MVFPCYQRKCGVICSTSRSHTSYTPIPSSELKAKEKDISAGVFKWPRAPSSLISTKVVKSISNVSENAIAGLYRYMISGICQYFELISLVGHVESYFHRFESCNVKLSSDFTSSTVYTMAIQKCVNHSLQGRTSAHDIRNGSGEVEYYFRPQA